MGNAGTQIRRISTLLIFVSFLCTLAFLYFDKKDIEKRYAETVEANDNMAERLKTHEKVIEAQFLKLEGNHEEADKLLAMFKDSPDHIIQKSVVIADSMNRNNKEIVEVKVIVPEKRKADTVIINYEDDYKDKIEALVTEIAEKDVSISTLEEQLENNRNKEPLLLESSKGTKFRYLGDLNKDKANGYGVAVYDSGSTYEGEWKNNMRHGEGAFSWKDGESYTGTYKNDMREGYGIYVWKNGDKYEGEWKNDSRHGEGKLMDKNGSVKKEGLWESDSFKQSMELQSNTDK